MTLFKWMSVTGAVCVIFLTTSVCSFGDAFVEVVMSSQDGSRSLSVQPPISFVKARKTKETSIVVDPSVRYQSLLGMGASFDHATCENLAKLPVAIVNSIRDGIS